MVKGQPFDPDRTMFFGLWGAFVACEAHVWLGLLSHIEFSPIPLLNSVLKSLFNQCSILPVLTALFLIAASAFLQGMPLSELSDEAVRTLLANGFSTRYAYSASFWLFSDSLTFSLVPVERRISWIVCMSAIWSVLSSAITY